MRSSRWCFLPQLSRARQAKIAVTWGIGRYRTRKNWFRTEMVAAYSTKIHTKTMQAVYVDTLKLLQISQNLWQCASSLTQAFFFFTFSISFCFRFPHNDLQIILHSLSNNQVVACARQPVVQSADQSIQRSVDICTSLCWDLEVQRFRNTKFWQQCLQSYAPLVIVLRVGLHVHLVPPDGEYNILLQVAILLGCLAPLMQGI